MPLLCDCIAFGIEQCTFYSLYLPPHCAQYLQVYASCFILSNSTMFEVSLSTRPIGQQMTSWMLCRFVYRSDSFEHHNEILFKIDILVLKMPSERLGHSFNSSWLPSLASRFLSTSTIEPLFQSQVC